MRIAAAIALVVSALYFAAAPTSAEAKPQIRGNNCFSGVGSDAGTAEEECKGAGFTCAAPKVMRCYFDNQRQEYICQCKAPKPGAYLIESERRQQSRPVPESEYQRETPPSAEQEPQAETEPQQLRASAGGC